MLIFRVSIYLVKNAVIDVLWDDLTPQSHFNDGNSCSFDIEDPSDLQVEDLRFNLVLKTDKNHGSEDRIP